ncbi:MAG: UDP-N-acetylglucosamine 1-carboxyvinyltransferase [Parcubacteria group bacterium Licking1014_17]|nr:MAG: UDP-N-acetylglucosamine 1-carboxyvinyltransferase [Parcubacteria group bacterium Licking1014_17]
MRLIINGGKKLNGRIAVNGSKNCCLPLISAALLTGQHVTITNVPGIDDVKSITELINSLGVLCHFSNNTFEIYPGQITQNKLDRTMSRKMRASILLTAPVLARTGEVFFPHPGGCVIGERPIDIFLDGYQKFGAAAYKEGDDYAIRAKKLKAGEYFFNNVSVTATESLIMLATLAQGRTTLINAACEPEVVEMANFLNQCGAKITGAGTPFVTIDGISSYDTMKTVIYRNIPDRIEAGSFILMAVATGSEITVANCVPEHLQSLLTVLDRMQVGYEKQAGAVKILNGSVPSAVSVKTHEYPGFPTDLQSPLIVALTQAKGLSIVQETVFEGRMFWTEDLKRMGAEIMVLDTFRVSVQGPSKLRGHELESPDIRAGMAYVIAGLAAKGTTTVHGINLIDRGYERIENRLSEIGADVVRIN